MYCFNRETFSRLTLFSAKVLATSDKTNLQKEIFCVVSKKNSDTKLILATITNRNKKDGVKKIQF